MSRRHPYYRDTGKLTVGGWPHIVRTAGPDDDTPEITSAEREVLRCDLCWLNISHTRLIHTEDRHWWEIEPHSHQWRHGVDGDPWCSRCGTDRIGGPCVP